MTQGRRVITDNSLFERVSQNALSAFSYEKENYPLGEILSKLAPKKEATDWRKLKPLYIQPPPVFKK